MQAADIYQGLASLKDCRRVAMTNGNNIIREMPLWRVHVVMRDGNHTDCEVWQPELLHAATPSE